jgi:hypothetical protein
MHPLIMESLVHERIEDLHREAEVRRFTPGKKHRVNRHTARSTKRARRPSLAG